MSKVTSKKLASIAGELLQMSDAELRIYIERRLTLRELRALAASVLVQREPVEQKPTKARAAKRKEPL